MTNLNPNPPTLNTPWRNKPQGLNEFMSLINFIEHPALLVDRAKGLVWGANNLFLDVTAFEAKDFIGQPLTSLVAGLVMPITAREETANLSLRRRLREPIPANVQVKQLEGNNQLYLVIIDDKTDAQVRLTKILTHVANAMIKIADLSLEGDFDRSIKFLSAMIRQTMEAQNVCIYQADPQSPRLVKLIENGSPAIFSDSISSTDLIRLSKVNIWQPGKRMSVEIHQAGHAAKMEYVASVPLGQTGKLFGLLVLADQKEPVEKLNILLEIFGAQVTRFFENHMLMENLRQQVLDEKKSHVISQAVMENAREGILLVKPTMELLAMNSAAEWMLGYADWEVKGQPVESVLIGPENLMPALTAAMRGIPTHNIGNVSLHRRNGQSFPAHIQTIPVEKEGEVTSLVVFISDVSEHEEIRLRTQQLEQRAVLGDVTAVFAHEVRNPITNIYTGLQVLAANLPADDPNQDNLTRLQNDCMRLNHLMESVLNFSRNTEYKFEPVDLKMLLQRMIERWRPRFNNLKVKPFFQCEEGVPPVSADPKGLEQVFTNLISNATDAMAKTGGNLAVKISTRAGVTNRSQVVVSVTDDGPGIPEDIRERIFEPFVTTKSHGTGLGLAITRRIVNAHHGSIQLISFPGGTVFEVTLLAYQGAEE
jgi:PAS domain S-box-containing protein